MKIKAFRPCDLASLSVPAFHKIASTKHNSNGYGFDYLRMRIVPSSLESVEKHSLSLSSDIFVVYVKVHARLFELA